MLAAAAVALRGARGARGMATAIETTLANIEAIQKLPADHYVGRTGAQILCDLLRRHSVKDIFGYPGGAILPVFDALSDEKDFNFVLPRHEQGGGFMAQGYSRATGRVGVCLVTSGPGATNLVTPLVDALMDSTPLVALAGQVPTSAVGTDAFQEADVTGITRPATKYNSSVKDVRELPRKVNEAFFVATSGRPGPVLLDLPKDVTAATLQGPVDYTPHLPHFSKSSAATVAPVLNQEAMANIARAVELINKAERPVIYAGQGVLLADASSELRELARTGSIPVTTAMQGLGAFDETDDLALQMLGMHGSVAANRAMQAADLVIGIGARFDDRVTGRISGFAPEARRAESEGRGGIIHIDIAPQNLDKVIQATVPIAGDALKVLREVLPRVQRKDRAEWVETVMSWKREFPFSHTRGKHTTAELTPHAVLQELNRQLAALNKPTVVSTGVGQHQMLACQYLTWRHPRSWVSSGGLGSMGFGVGASIGAKVGVGEDAMVINVDGDGSFVMAANELATAAQYGLGVKQLVLNNATQGMVKQWQDLFYDKRGKQFTDMVNPDFAKLAEAYGCEGMRLEREADLEATIAKFLATDKPVVLDAIVCANAFVWPMVPAGASLSEMVLGPSDSS